MAAVGFAGLVEAACGGPRDLVSLPASQVPAEVAFHVAEDSYGQGDTIRLLLENRGPREVGFNLCKAVLEILVDGVWSEVSRWEADGTLHYCYDELTRIRPGVTATELQPVFGTYELGVYRFRYELLLISPDDQERVPVVSNGFRIE